MNKKTLIIAEAGVNHNGDLELAKSLLTQLHWRELTWSSFKLLAPTAK